MLPFTISCPTQVRFGAGAVNQIASVLSADPRNVLLIRGAGTAASEPLRAALRTLDLQVTEVSAAGEPSVSSVNTILAGLSRVTIDAVVACGGGAVIDTGKAVTFCLAHSLQLTEDFAEIDAALLVQPNPVPLIVLPTTAGTGAEVTSNAVLDVPSKQAKISLRGRALFPQTAIIDPDLMCDAPRHVILNAGLDALTQIIEAYISSAASPFSDAMTAPQLEPGLLALRTAMEDPTSVAMSQMAWTSLASGLALANSGLGAAHGLASVLGARYAAPHGALCGRFLTPVLRRNLANAAAGSTAHERIDHCCAMIATTFPPLTGGDDLSGAEAWMKTHKLPYLSAYGVAADDLETLAKQSLTASSTRKNAVPIDQADLLHILLEAL